MIIAFIWIDRMGINVHSFITHLFVWGRPGTAVDWKYAVCLFLSCQQMRSFPCHFCHAEAFVLMKHSQRHLLVAIGFRLCIYDSFGRRLKDGADINRALVYFKGTPSSSTILSNRGEVATSVDDLAINFELQNISWIEIGIENNRLEAPIYSIHHSLLNIFWKENQSTLLYLIAVDPWISIGGCIILRINKRRTTQ